MSADKVTNLVHLVAMLEGSSKVAWNDVQRLVRGFPGWERLVELLLDPPLPTKGGVFFETQGTYVSEAMQEKLLETLQSYAILVSMKSSPIECAALLERDARIDAIAFCRQAIHDKTPEIAESSEIALKACQNQETLVRGSRSPSDSKSAAASEAGFVKQNWFRRLFH